MDNCSLIWHISQKGLDKQNTCTFLSKLHVFLSVVKRWYPIARSYCLLCWKLQSARRTMSLPIQSAEGIVRKVAGKEEKRSEQKGEEGKSAEIKKMPQNEIKMSAPLSHRLNIKDNPVKCTWLAWELSRMLSSVFYLLPTMHALILSLLITPQHSGIIPMALISPMELFFLSHRQQETGRHGRVETSSHF